MNTFLRSVVIGVLACAGALASTVRVAQTIVGPDSTNADGKAYIRISAPCKSGFSFVGDRTIAVSFTGGDFHVDLVPTDACVTAGGTGSAWDSGQAYATGDHVQYAGGVWAAIAPSTGVVPGSSSAKWKLISPTYSVTWILAGGQQWTETWAIPSSPSSTTVDAVRVQVASVPSLVIAGPPGPTGPTGPLPSWLDASNLSAGTYCIVKASDGTVTLASCSLSWATLTSAQWAGLTSSQWASLAH